MWIIGCDYHPGFEVVSIFDNRTGEVTEKKLLHPQEAEQFYRGLEGEVRVGIEASGHCQWFARLLAECGHELWIGDAARIRAMAVRKQKTDRRDAGHILELMISGRFPRIWVPTEEERDVRQLLLHRHQRVRMRTQAKNQLQALMLNQGVQRGRRLWSASGRAALSAVELLPYAARRRAELIANVEELDRQIGELDRLVAAEAEKREAARRLMTHPGVGPNTALMMVLTLGDVGRFENARKVAAYLGLAPTENSSGGKQRLGHISKQGSAFARFLLVEAGQTAAKKNRDEALYRAYVRLAAKKSRAVAKVMVARRLAVRLYWMLRKGWTYAEWQHAGEPGSSCGGR
jgi:transposase